MIHGALREPLERGWLQAYCVDAIDEESWYARWAHPGGRAYRHHQYIEYLHNEVLPLTRCEESESLPDDDGGELRRVSRDGLRR